MKLYINFEGLLDHQDILSEELRKSEQFMELVQSTLHEVPEGDVQMQLKIRKIKEDVVHLQRNIRSRKHLMVDIADSLKIVYQKNKNTVEKIELQVQQLSDLR